jgi:MFS family permease
LFVAFNLFYAAFPVHAAAAWGWHARELGLFFAVLSGLLLVAQGPLLAFASKHLGHRVLFALGMAFLVLAFVGFRMSTGPLSFAGAACFAIGNGLSWPTFQARVAEIGGDEQGVVQGAVTSASSLASIAGLIVGALLYPALGGALFLVAAGLFAVVLIFTPAWFARRAPS